MRGRRRERGRRRRRGRGRGGPNWGDGTAALNYNGPDSTDYNTFYTLKSSEETDPWQRLIHTCDLLNNTPIEALSTVAADVLDVDRVLWFLACENAFGDDDSYIYKGKMDYYVYWDEVTGQMTPLEYDGNSVLVEESDNWGVFYHADDENYPLLHKLLQIPEYRERYLAHMRTVIDESLNLLDTQAFLTFWSNFIDAQVESDPKKIYSYNHFLNEVDALQDHLTTRRNVLLSNPELNSPAPTFLSLTMNNVEDIPWGTVSNNEEVDISVAFEDSPADVMLFFSGNWDASFQPVAMNADENGLWHGTIPPFSPGTVVRFYVEAIAENGARAYHPTGAEHDVFYYTIEPEWATESPVVINELVAKNSEGASDGFGEFEDWVELFNPTNQTVDLGGWYLTDNPWNVTKWPLPDTTLGPQGYLIVWADEDGSQGPMHANFKLAASGEQLWLIGPEGWIQDESNHPELAAGASWARIPNGTGPFIIQPPTHSVSNETVGEIENFEASFSVHPNPVQSGNRFDLLLPSPGKWDITWRCTRGQVLYQQQMTCRDRTVHWDSVQWPMGVYLLTAVHENGLQVTRSVIVQ